MDNALYTHSMTLIAKEDSIAPAIKEAIAQLIAAYPEQSIQAYFWNEHYIAVPLRLCVNLPSRGPIGDIDIREEEPIILVLHRDYYPYHGTLVYSNRRDFPRHQLPHLNPVDYTQPISFCLHRTSFNDWMADRTIFDLVERVRQWLCDAARNRLIPPGDGWEALRIVDAIGISIYPADKIQNHVQQQWHLTKGKMGFSTLHYKLLPHESHDPLVGKVPYALELVDFVDAQKASRVVKKIREINLQYNPDQPTERHLLGMLMWPDANNICDRYFASIPKQLSDLLQWDSDLGLSIKKALELYQRKDYQFFGGIPIIVAINRPMNLIGQTSDIELLNLVILSNEQALVSDDVWNEDASVIPLLNRTPLTTQKAQEISRTQNLESATLLVFGCGAVGSKLVMHMARAGLTNMTLVDYDELSPHNLVRHALLASSVGENKADGLFKEITNMYRERLKLKVIRRNGLAILLDKRKQLIRQNAWLVDTTASSAFQRAVVETPLPDNIRVMRAGLAHNGQIGMMSIEGSYRNPRLDDIQAHIFDLACAYDNLSAWLKAEEAAAKNELQFEEIAIGMGCHTDTMRLADDVISLHTALISTSFKRQIIQVSDSGYLQISFLSEENDISNLQIPIPKVEVLHAHNDQSWEIRVADQVKQQILGLVAESGRNETGGILIGRADSARKLIHVTKALPPPPDSQSTPYMFVRGIRDVWDSVRHIQSVTGGLLDYVGEWHSHPTGGGQMSYKDKEAARQLQSVLKPAGMPVHIMIATPSRLHAHVYTGDIAI